MRRKFLSVVLCVCMMLTMAPFAFAEGDSGVSTNDNVSTTSGASGGGSGTVTQAVAQIDNTTYNTLSGAIAAAENGKTITLLSNTSGQVVIPTDKDITLDLNGNTITHTGETVYNLGKLTIRDSSNDKSGKIISTGYVGVGVGHNSTTTIEYANIESVEGAVITGYATGATITINDGKFSASDNAVIAGNGNNTDNNATVRVNPNKINILGGTFTGNIQTSGYIACGIYAPWKDIITVSGGNFIVNNGIGIVARAGQVTVTGGSFICNGTAKGKVGDKKFDMNAAQPVYFDASNPAYPAYNSKTDYIKLLGGTFSSDVTSYVAENYTCIQNNDKYTVKALNEVAVAKIGDNLYTSLSAAISAASDGQTVTLLKNATENVNISAEKSVAINLNGYTVTVPSDCGIELQGKLTVTGNGKITCANTPIRVNGNSAKLTVDSGTIESTGDYGIYAMNGGSVVVNDGTLTASLAVLSGNNTTGDMNFEVNGGTLTSQLSEAIYMPGQVSLKVTGGTINGGISTRMGQITVTGGTINGMTGNTDSISDYYHYSGSAWIGDAIYVLAGTYSSNNQQYQNSCNITISGGTINGNSQYGLAVYKIGTGSKQTVNVNITGGKFSGSKGAVAVVDSGFEHTTCPPNNTPHVSANPTNVTTSTSISGGYFTTDPTAYVASGYAAKSSNKADYAYMVAKKENNEVIVKPAVATPKVELGNQIVAEKKEAVTASAQSVKVPEIANAAAKNVSISSSQAEQYIKEANLTPSAGQEVILYVQSFLDVTPTAYNEATKTYTLDITPKYQIVASTATTADQIKLTDTDGATNGKNAVVVKEATVLNVTEPTQVSFTLPDSFVTALGSNPTPTIYVKHTKSNGKAYIYSATLNGNTLTFTNPNGFSTFTVTTTAPVATVNGIGYESLQEAANAANNGDEITVNSGTSHTLDFNTTKSVKVTNKTGAEMTVKFNGTDKNIANNTTETFSYTRPSSASGSTSTTYDVNVNAATNGAVAADKKTASKGTTVTVTASPSKGYVVDAVKVVDKDGKDVAVTEKDGKYVFTMPASAVTVTGTFKAETSAPVGLPFTDVKSGNWFYDAVKYAYAQGLMTGTSATTFAPNGTMNRAMIVTVLYRLEKSPAVTGASKFTDVPAGQWYSDAVAWAAANKIVNGYDETTFGPMNAVTREQMAAILFRYEQVKGLENVTLEENLNRFPDQNKISAYAIPALQWAVGQKIINGNADGTLDPTGTATRAQVAQIFTNLLNQ